VSNAVIARKTESGIAQTRRFGFVVNRRQI
jgi:hypothetical protein